MLLQTIKQHTLMMLPIIQATCLRVESRAKAVGDHARRAGPNRLRVGRLNHKATLFLQRARAPHIPQDPRWGEDRVGWAGGRGGGEAVAVMFCVCVCVGEHVRACLG